MKSMFIDTDLPHCFPIFIYTTESNCSIIVWLL